MKKPFYFLLLILLLGCQQQPTDISQEEVMSTVQGFFDSFDADIEQQTIMDDYLTDDFLIFENGKKMTKAEFADFVSDTREMFESTEWVFSDIRLSSDANSAHVSMLNTGHFVTKGDSLRTEMNLEWLESAYLVRKNGQLKIRFYFSDGIKREIDTLK